MCQLSMCQSSLSGRIDEVVVEAFLEALRPAGLDATLAALRGLEQERRDVDRQWQLRLERARYEARLAQRQYNAVDPDNCLIARELERPWEAALAEVKEVQQEYGYLRLTELRPLDAVEVEDVRRLASDLPSLWQADTTTPVDRKRLLRLVVASVTVTIKEGRTGADVAVLWSGSARTAHQVDSPEFNAHLRTKAGTLDAIRDLAGRMPDHRVAATLAQRGLLSRHSKPWTPVRWRPCGSITSPWIARLKPGARACGPTVRARTGGGTVARDHPERHPGVGALRRDGLRSKQGRRKVIGGAQAGLESSAPPRCPALRS